MTQLNQLGIFCLLCETGFRKANTISAGEGSIIQSVERALHILQAFSHEKRELALNEITETAGFHRSTVYRLVRTLEKHDFLSRPADSNKYQIGPRAFAVGSLFVTGNTLVDRARPVIEKLRRELGWTAQVNVLDGDEILVVATVESPSLVRIAGQLGMRIPLHSTASGKAILSTLPEGELDRVLGKSSLHKFTNKTITSPEDLKAELSDIAEQGYSVNDEEWMEGLFALAAPVRAHLGPPAALAVACPVQLVPRDRLEDIAQTVMEAGRELSRLMGVDTLGRREEHPHKAREQAS